MSWATIGDLQQVDSNHISLHHFNIPAGGSDPANQGNCLLEPIFYKQDVEALLNQENAHGIRLINTFLNTPEGQQDNVNPLPFTFLVACTEDSRSGLINLNQINHKVAITCPPIYIRNAEYNYPQPGAQLPLNIIALIDSNSY